MVSLIKLMEIFKVSSDYIMGFSDVRIPLAEAEDDEMILLNYYRALCEHKKELVLAYIKGLREV